MKSIKNELSRIIGAFSPSLFFSIAYIHNRKRIPRFRHPHDLSELWIKYILDGKPKEMFWLADKYKVRDYVKNKGLGDILVPLVGGASLGLLPIQGRTYGFTIPLCAEDELWSRYESCVFR